jgi:WD40 repeat protein
VDRLPEGHRAPVVLCYLEGRTQDEAAVLLGVSKGTVKKRLEAARVLLRGRLARRGLGSAAVLAVAVCPGATAAVPGSLACSTIEAATLLAAGHAGTPGAIPAAVAALTEGGLATVSTTRLKTTLAVLVLTAVGLGSVLYLRHEAGARPAEKAAAGKPPKVLQLDARGRRVAWCPDGKTLAVVTKNESMLTRKGSAIKLWDVETGKVRATLVESADAGLAFQHVAFAPDGKTIAATVSEQIALPNVVGARSVVTIWDAKTLALRQTIGGNDSQMAHVAFSPESKLVATCDPTNKEIRLWATATGALERTFGTGVPPWSAAFSPDGATLAVGGQNADGSGEIALWDVRKGRTKHTVATDTFAMSVAFSPDGKLVAGGHGGGKVHVLGVEQGERVALLRGDRHAVRSVAFVSNGVVAAGGADGKVLLWDVRTGESEGTLEGHTAEVHAVACSRDGMTLASTGQDQTLRLWSINLRPKAANGRRGEPAPPVK